MEWYVGTSGYNYKEWKGPFYPEKMPNKDMLGYYSERLKSVEINNTFYRVPKPHVVESRVDQVPEDFRFVAKATRRITHIKRLKEVGEETGYFLGIASHFRDRLGAILFQLPPYLKKDTDRLNTFLDLLPKGTPAAMEFRHATWYDDDVLEALRSHNVALCTAHDDEDGDDDVAMKFRSTANWGYLRLRGRGYTKSDLKTWVQKIESQDWERVFVFFKHEDEGAAPVLANQFLAMRQH
jgi:uncharacterized protein YecE (DUF72 family)